MSTQLEIELKWALTAQAHARLHEALTGFLGPGEILQQENRFFDTTDRRLRQQLLNLRLRQENDRVLMTCKAKRPTGEAGAHQNQEWEEWLDPHIWPQVMAGHMTAASLPLPPIILEALADQPLVPLGGFHNERISFHYTQKPLALLCLDKTNFGKDRIDYELEIECEQEVACSQFWRKQLAEWKISFTPQPITKFARFLQISAT